MISFYFREGCAYFTLSCFVFLIVLHFAFFLYLQHPKVTSISPAGFFIIKSVYCLSFYNYFHQHLLPHSQSWSLFRMFFFVPSNQQSQQATGHRSTLQTALPLGSAGLETRISGNEILLTLALDHAAIGIGNVNGLIT
jgi:hypothetical protein